MAEDNTVDVILENEDDGKVDVVIDDSGARPVNPGEVDGIEELRQRLEGEKLEAQNRARDAEARAARAEREAAEGRKSGADAQINHLTSVIEQQKSKGDLLEQRMADAWASGNNAEAAKIQRQLSQIEAETVQIVQAKNRLEWEKNNKPAQQQQNTQVNQQNDFAKQYPRSAAWVAANPDKVADSVGQAEVGVAHAKALKAGHQVDSESYIEYIDNYFNQGRVTVKAHTRPNPTVERKIVPAAPPSRISSEGGNKVKVRISQNEIDMAQRMGVTPEELARSHAETKKGKK